MQLTHVNEHGNLLIKAITYSSWSMKNSETKHATLRFLLLPMFFHLSFSFTLKKSSQNHQLADKNHREAILKVSMKRLFFFEPLLIYQVLS